MKGFVETGCGDYNFTSISQIHELYYVIQIPFAV